MGQSLNVIHLVEAFEDDVSAKRQGGGSGGGGVDRESSSTQCINYSKLSEGKKGRRHDACVG